MATATQVILTTCPRDCYDSCGIAVRIRDGAIAQVRGDPDHPMSRGKLCTKCAAGYNNEWRDPDVRLTRPLRRSGPKGSGQFAPVSWDEAIGEVAERLQRIVADGGAQTIVNAHYSGTLSLIAFYFPMRFFHKSDASLRRIVPVERAVYAVGHYDYRVALPRRASQRVEHSPPHRIIKRGAALGPFDLFNPLAEDVSVRGQL